MNTFETPPNLLDKINEQISIWFDGGGFKFEKLPEIDENILKIFKNKKIVLIDDDPNIFWANFPDLFTATNGSTEGLLVKRTMKIDEIVESIISQNPNIVITDNDLGMINNYDEGLSIVSKLRKLGYKGKIFGHSSSSYKANMYKEAGADDFIPKGSGKLLENLAEKLS